MAAERSGRHPADGARILVSEDSDLAAAVLRRALEAHGHRVTRAADGAAALALLEGPADFDLVVTDGEMPHLDGFGLCREIRRREGLRGMPVIFLSAATARVVEALDAGADDYLTKPFGEDELRARVDAALRMGRLRAELQAERDLSRALVASLQDGLAVFSGTGEILEVNDRLAEITGFGRDELVGRRAPFPFWPAERSDEYGRRLLAALVDDDAGEVDRVYVRRGGERRAVIVSLARLPGADPDGPSFVSTVKDVTRRRAAEEDLRRSEATHRELAREQGALGRAAAAAAAVSVAPEEVFALVAREIAGLLDVEVGGVARFASDHAVLVGSWATVASMRLPVGARLPLDDDGLTARVWREGRAVRTGAGMTAPEAGHVPRRAAVAAPVSVGGAPWGVVGALSMREDGLGPEAERRLASFARLVGLAIASAQARAELLELASTDALTGLANRRSFDARLAEEVAAAHLTGAPLSVVVLDLDHFKRVNDRFGHEAGDETLRALAARMRGAARAGDVVARTGGEEFGWILPGAALGTAVAAAERLRRHVAGTPLALVGTQTISAGVAQLAPGDDGAALVRRADGRLYGAKEAGRDRVAAGVAVPA